MSVDASNSMSDVWAKLAGQVVNDAFALRRLVGSSDHSGVFLSSPANGPPSDIALKLVPAPAIASLADSQLSLWRAAAELVHPHLMRLFEVGRCRFGGLPYLYAVMEYADQDLAQLLQRRALTEEETREMLVPTLGALAFLHARQFVQGQLKPSNVLVVGDQLKLASETIRPVSDVAGGGAAVSVYDPPEARDGRSSTSGDIWRLGTTMVEALTRRRPSGVHGGAEGAGSPPDLSPAFREIVVRCLSRRPDDRPSVSDLQAWVRAQPGAPTPVAAPPPAELTVPAPAVPEPALSVMPLPQPAIAQPVVPAAPLPQPAIAQPVIPAAAPQVVIPAAATLEPIAAVPVAPIPAESETATPNVAAPETMASSAIARELPRLQPEIESVQRPAVAAEVTARASSQPTSKPPTLALILGALVVFALSWVGIRALRTPSAATPPAAPAAEVAREAPAQNKTAPVARTQPASLPAPAPSKAKPADAAAELSALHEVIPDIPRTARRTIRGTLKVSVRVIIEKDGTVFAALADDPGPSRYFERRALEAAKKWTFPATETEGQRFMLLRFSFTREGTTARLAAVR
jgi:hypothetical protein